MFLGREPRQQHLHPVQFSLQVLSYYIKSGISDVMRDTVDNSGQIVTGDWPWCGCLENRWFSSQNSKNKKPHRVYSNTWQMVAQCLSTTDVWFASPQTTVNQFYALYASVCFSLPVCMCGCLLEPRTQGLILVISLKGRLWGRGCSVKLSGGTWSTSTLRWGCTATTSHTE